MSMANSPRGTSASSVRVRKVAPLGHQGRFVKHQRCISIPVFNLRRVEVDSDWYSKMCWETTGKLPSFMGKTIGNPIYFMGRTSVSCRLNILNQSIMTIAQKIRVVFEKRRPNQISRMCLYHVSWRFFPTDGIYGTSGRWIHQFQSPGTSCWWMLLAHPAKKNPADKTHRIHVLYGIYANIWGILMVNVTIYSIHGSCGKYDKVLEKPSRFFSPSMTIRRSIENINFRVIARYIEILRTSPDGRDLAGLKINIWTLIYELWDIVSVKQRYHDWNVNLYSWHESINHTSPDSFKLFWSLADDMWLEIFFARAQ